MIVPSTRRSTAGSRAGSESVLPVFRTRRS